MKNIAFLLITLLATISVHAQDFQISFTGSGLSGTVDSVQVKNLTQDTNITLLGSDILNLVQVLGTDKPQSLNSELSIYPNPVKETSVIEFYSTQNEDVNLEIYDVLGRTLVSQTGNVRPGKNSFEISGFSSGNYIATIATNTWQESLRFVSVGGNNQKPLILQKGAVAVLPKSTELDNTTNNVVQMQYNTGEILLFRAYANDNIRLITLVPTQSQTVDFEFVSCQDTAGIHYPVVTIGNQNWMAANLNYATGNSWCYDNDPANCDTYGRLYDWQTVMNGSASSNNNPSGVQGICPPGWHVPSDAEWTQLVNHVGVNEAGAKLKSTSSLWNASDIVAATNSSGFSSIPGGLRNVDGFFTSLGSHGIWWSSTESSAIRAWNYLMYYSSVSVFRNKNFKTNGLSCRCILD